jgi:hypothetical protein
MKKAFLGAVSAAGLLALGCSSGNANSFAYDNASVNGFAVQINGPGIVGDVEAGRIDLFEAGHLLLSAFCVDVFHFLQVPGTHTTFDYSLASLPLPGVGTLTTSTLNQIGDLVSHGLTDGSAFDDGITQLAIWKVEYGNSFSYTAGSTVTNAVDALIAATDGQSAPAGWTFQFLDTVGAPNQTLVTGAPGTIRIVGTPEPSTWAMGLIGFAALAFMGVKRSRKDRLAAAL